MPEIDSSWFQIDPWSMAIVITGVVIFLAVVVIWGIRAHRRQVLAGQEEMIGKTAEVTKALEPKGTVFIEDEHWTAISEQGRVEPGEEVIVTKVEGLKLWVTKKE